MLTRLPGTLAAAMTALAAVGCASTGAHSNQPNTTSLTASLPGTPGCFWVRNVWGWTVLNDSELIIHAPLERDGYLVKLFEPVFDLPFHIRLGFQDVERTGLICGPNRDYLIVRGYTPPRIPIVAVQKLTAAEQVQLLRGAKLSIPRQLQQPATSPAPTSAPTTPAAPTSPAPASRTVT